MRSNMRRVHVDLDEEIKKLAVEHNLSYTAASKLLELRIKELEVSKHNVRRPLFKI